MKQKNRPFSTLILNLKIARQLAWKSFGIWPRFPVTFPFSSKPGSCPEPRDSPIISAGQKIFARKRGGGVLHRASRDARVVSLMRGEIKDLPCRPRNV